MDLKETSKNSSFEEIYNLKKNKVKKVNTTQNQIISNDISIKRSKLALPEDNNIINNQTFAQSSLSGISRNIYTLVWRLQIILSIQII